MDGVPCVKHSSVEYELGFFLFGNFQGVLKILGMLLLFALGLKFLWSDWFSTGLIRCFCDAIGYLKIRVPSRNVVDTQSNSDLVNKMDEEWKLEPDSYTDSDGIVKAHSAEDSDSDGTLVFGENPNPDFGLHFDGMNVEKENNPQEEENFDEEFAASYDTTDEDGESDISSLRRQLKIERSRSRTALVELAKERAAAATAAEEAMAMILRLQREKSAIEMEWIQYRRMAEEKQAHDQEVIQSLQWLVWRNGENEDEVGVCRENLEYEGSSSEREVNGNLWDAFENVFYSSLDADEDLLMVTP